MLSRLRPDIVHTHTAKAGALGRTAAALVGIRSRVHTFHGHLLHGYFSPRVTRSIVVAERVLATQTDRLVAVGGTVRDELLGAGVGKSDQYVVIPPGVSLAKSPPTRQEARIALGLPEDGPVVAYVARLTKVKRPDRMIAVAREIPEATFVVAGDGPLQSELQANAPSNVRFLGWRADMENVYSAANTILLTSDNEGMPVSLIEAALCGIPAVTTRVGSTHEVVLEGRTGWIVPPDTVSISATVRNVISDENGTNRIGRAAQTWAKGVFGVEQMTTAHERLYESLISSPSRRLRRK